MGIIWPLVLSALSGCVWAGIVVAIHDQALYWPMSAGLVASPAIGVAMGVVSYTFLKEPIPIRMAIAVGTLYAAAALFGVATGVADQLWGSRPAAALSAGDIARSAADMVFGLTISGYALLLAPVSYVNHAVISQCWIDLARDTSR